MTELEFAEKIRRSGGRAYLVGGAVRDKIRGVPAHDRDYCVTGLDEKIFTANFPDVPKFGKAFPVYSLDIGGAPCEVAFARTERKIGTGYRGFEILFSPNVTIEQDLYRRDTTINAMAIELLSGELIDPFGGRQDVLSKKIRPVSAHFTDDPVRALRAARQAAQFGFELCAETLAMMNRCGEELSLEPSERIFSELKTALKTDKPSIFFRSLERAGLLEITFPEISNLRGNVQPSEFQPSTVQPESDAYEHTLQLLDDVAQINPKPIVRFAALIHDLGKSTLPKDVSPRHSKEDRGREALLQMNRRMTLPTDWKKSALFVLQHRRAPRLERAEEIVRLLLSLHALKFLTVKDFCDLVRVDNCGLPPYLEHAQEILDELLKIGGKDAPPELTGAAVGSWILAARVRRFNQLPKEFTTSITTRILDNFERRSARYE